MGQNQSCLSSAENVEAARRRHNRGHQPSQITHPFTTRLAPDHGKDASHNRVSYQPETTKTSATDPNTEEDLPDHDRNHGYNLVDLKGDRLLHTEPRTLQGCEVWIHFNLMRSGIDRLNLLFICRSMLQVSASGWWWGLSGERSTTTTTRCRWVTTLCVGQICL